MTRDLISAGSMVSRQQSQLLKSLGRRDIGAIYLRILQVDLQQKLDLGATDTMWSMGLVASWGPFSVREVDLDILVIL